MSYAPTKDTRPGDLFHSYMRGWRHGAATTAMSPKFTEHEDPEIRGEYERGYRQGYDACRLAQSRASDRLGYEPSILRTQVAD